MPARCRAKREGKTRISRVEAIVFTWNNPPDGAFEALTTRLAEHSYTWAVGQEVGESGTPHLQGCVVDKRRPEKRVLEAWITADHPDCKPHFETCRNQHKGLLYCVKEGRARTNYPPARDVIEMDKGLPPFSDTPPGQTEPPNCPPPADSVSTGTGRRDTTPNSTPGWHEQLHHRLLGQTRRTVTVLIDPQGNLGKSWFAARSYRRYPGTIVVGSTKLADLAMLIGRALSKGKPVRRIVFDIPRTLEAKFVSYSAIESVKNGLLTHAKGCGDECGIYQFPSPQVIVFTNQDLDYTRMSTDRWDLLDPTPYGLVSRTPF